jgi:hypothetical protein
VARQRRGSLDRYQYAYDHNTNVTSMHVRGLDNARESVLRGDGIPWIWNHRPPLADEAIQILDWYHAKEHLSALAKVLEKEGTEACMKLLQELETLL